MKKTKRKTSIIILKYAVLISALMIAVTCTGFYARNNLRFLINRPVSAEMHRVNLSEPLENREKSVSAFSNISINSAHAFLIQLEKGGDKILFDKGGSERIYPASMTKIMTTVIAIESIKDLDTKITLREKMFSTIYDNNSSVAGFSAGETLRAIDLLYGLMLPSGAECAIGLAEYVSVSESAFVDLMNKKARQLGMNDTHFMNTTGLHDNNHYSTARDIATLVEYAIKNDTFYKIFTTARYSTKPTNRHPDGITFYSTLFSKMESAKFKGGVILGGKTGYTGEAGQCLASLAEKGGKRFILVTCDAPGDNETQQLHIDDAIMVFNKLN